MRRHVIAAGLAILVLAAVVVIASRWGHENTQSYVGQWEADQLLVDGTEISALPAPDPNAAAGGVLPPTRVLELDDSSGTLRVSGLAGCNQFGADVDTHEGFVVEDLMLTVMACPPPLDDFEHQYIDGLGRVTDAEVSDGRLELTGDGVTLIFTKR